MKSGGESKHSKRNIGRDQRGQMAIFLVLIFQVLFVFFAMAINVGLVVHDKINLQNSVDLAAYYGAARQAELLNEIGHINYQMRQAFKLLTFRIRGIGSYAIGYPSGGFVHPGLFDTNLDPATSESTPTFQPLGTSQFAPAVCMGADMWKEYKDAEAGSANSVGLCKTFATLTPVPGAGGGGGVLSGLVGSLDALLAQVAANIELRCNQVGAINWQLATRFLMAYRIEVEKRAEMIDELAQRLSQPGQDMTDFRGGNVFAGVRKTLENNLTQPQRAALSNLTFINSLSDDVPGQCNTPNFWLPKIEIFPVVTYVRMIFSGGCTRGIQANRGAAPSLYASIVGSTFSTLQSQWSSQGSNVYGYEKNPWCPPYVGVRASTTPRKLFSPFGTPVSIEAAAFAKPFGGRIGPWYFRTWPEGSPTSSGSGRSEMVDRLLPSRSGAAGASAPAEDLVNHSKYPGDVHGMNSVYAMNRMQRYIRQTLFGNAPITAPRPANFAVSHYQHLGDPANFESSGNSLATNNVSGHPEARDIRRMEEAAIAPDLFDATYYSIESRFFDNYANTNDPRFRSNLTDLYLDVGATTKANPYSITTQMNTAKNQVYSGCTGSFCPFYFIKEPAHLLTGWAQNAESSVDDYEFPDSKFGRCIDPKGDTVNFNSPAPSGCAAGGRSGYSVKIVSKDYLKEESIEGLGGSGISGAILNPPPD